MERYRHHRAVENPLATREREREYDTADLLGGFKGLLCGVVRGPDLPQREVNLRHEKQVG
jgi:hypothetical protein